MPAQLDLYIDPATLDFVDTDDGLWLEAADSRTAVLWQVEQRADAWWANDGTGSRVKALLEREEPCTADELVDEARRALQLLVDESVIADLDVQLAGEELDRASITISYTDIASGRRADVSVVPSTGGS